MAIGELGYASAGELLKAFTERSISPVEVLDALYARADAVEPDLNAFSSRRTEQAYAAARASETRWMRGEALPLDGIPVAMKEEHAIEGETWQLGSLLFEHQIATSSHPLYELLTGAGAVVHARTTTPEFSCTGYTHTRLWGLTKNPWNPAISCGGSSGGSGASLAAGTTILATGSDIGGSIRIPSSLNGVVGFKPPHGRVPTVPPYHLDTYSHEGPMGRTVRDVALMQNAIAGAHPLDHVSMRFPPILPAEPQSVRGLRIAVARTIGDVPVDDDVEANTRAVADVLRAAGAQVAEVQVPVTREEFLTTALIHFGTIFGASLATMVRDHRDMLTDYAIHFHEYSTEVAAGQSVLAGLEMESSIQARIAAVMDGFDALVCPTLTTTGWLAGDSYIDKGLEVGGQTVRRYSQAMLTLPFNIASKHPVLAVPSGRASNGVPTGVQVVAHTYDDEMAFRVGAAIERGLGLWSDPAWRP